MTEADAGLPDQVLQRLPADLDPSLGRRVYSGPEGQCYVVPGPGSICFIATGDAIGTSQGETTTALAAESGHGFICAVRDRPVTFVGVLPTGGQGVEIIDRAARRIAVPLTSDDGYWVEVSDPVAMFVIREDGTRREIPSAGSSSVERRWPTQAGLRPAREQAHVGRRLPKRTLGFPRGRLFGDRSYRTAWPQG